jgi:hypothetical protein
MNYTTGLLERIFAAHADEKFKTADGLDDAVVGITRGFNEPPRIAYSVNKCIAILESRDGMTHEEAREFFDFNVSGAYVGKDTPVWVEDDYA